MNTKTIVIALLLLGVAITKADPALSVDTVDSAQLKCLLSISLQQTTKGRLLGKDIARGDRRSGGVTKIAAVSPFGASPDKIAREDKKSGGMVRIASSAPGTGGSKIVRGDKKSGGDVKIAYVSPRASGDKIVRGDKTNGGNIKIAALGVNRAIFIINEKAKKAQIILPLQDWVQPKQRSSEQTETKVSISDLPQLMLLKLSVLMPRNTRSNMTEVIKPHLQ